MCAGSDDAGVTVHNDDPRIDVLMAAAGNELNLAGHSVLTAFIHCAGKLPIILSKLSLVFVNDKVVLYCLGRLEGVVSPLSGTAIPGTVKR